MANWKKELEGILREIPGFDPWKFAGDSYLDHVAARDAINFFGAKLKHVEGSSRGEPFILRKWQAAIAGNLFGWKRKDDAGRIVRRFRKCLIYVPRGNGKTPFASGLALKGLFEDGEQGAQCYLAAGQREQAGILFRNAAGMIDQEDELKDACTMYRGDQHRSIVLKDDPLSFCKVIPADAAGQHGGIPHITVVDELHVQENRDLMDVFETAMSKKVRSQPMLVMITTADYERPSICNEVYDYAIKVRDGIVADSSFLPVIYELKPDEDWRDENNWAKANPNLDVSVSREALRQLVEKAKANPAVENAVKRLHFNMKTGTDVRVISMDRWDACKETYAEKDLLGRRCYGGLDMASRGDLASFTLVFPEPDDVPKILSYSWCPQDKIGWRETRRIPYDQWAKAGWLRATMGNRIDHREIRADIKSFGEKFQILQIAFDPRDATEIVQNLQDADGFDMIEVPQTINNLSAPTKDLLSRVETKQFRHDGNPVLRWAASNLALYYKGTIPPGESVLDFLDKVPAMPSKQSSADKIDPITALVLALLAMGRNPTETGTSVYETRGILEI